MILITACNNQHTKNASVREDTSLLSIKKNTIIKHDTAIVNDDNGSSTNINNAEGKPLIIAGESVGKVTLGTDASTLENILGKPDMSDAAMGKAWTTWYGKKPDDHNNRIELDIYTAYKDTSMRQRTVQQIRTTSSFFITMDRVHVYSSLSEIKNKYDVKKSAQYTSDGKLITIYDDKQKGIAFEVAGAKDQNICTGIIIHPANKSVNDIYIMLHPDMKRFDK